MLKLEIVPVIPPPPDLPTSTLRVISACSSLEGGAVDQAVCLARSAELGSCTQVSVASGCFESASAKRGNLKGVSSIQPSKACSSRNFNLFG